MLPNHRLRQNARDPDTSKFDNLMISICRAWRIGLSQVVEVAKKARSLISRSSASRRGGRSSGAEGRTPGSATQLGRDPVPSGDPLRPVGRPATSCSRASRTHVPAGYSSRSAFAASARCRRTILPTWAKSHSPKHGRVTVIVEGLDFCPRGQRRDHGAPQAPGPSMVGIPTVSGDARGRPSRTFPSYARRPPGPHR